MFAIIEISGKQYKVTPGQVLEVDKQNGKPGSIMEADRVLLFSDGKKTSVGTPTVKGISVKAKIIEHMKGGKLDIYRFKSKVRYRRHIGFRSQLSKIEIQPFGRA